MRIAAGSKISTLPERFFDNCLFCRFKIPAQIRKLCQNAVFGCSLLREVEIPENSQLEELRPESLSWGCEALAIYVPEGLGLDLTRFDEQTAHVLRIKSGDYPVLDHPLREWRALREIELPEGLKSVGECWFTRSAVKSVKIPACVEEIRDGAFAGCSAL